MKNQKPVDPELLLDYLLFDNPALADRLLKETEARYPKGEVLPLNDTDLTQVAAAGAKSARRNEVELSQ